MKIHRKFIQGLMLLALIMVAGVVHAQQQSVFDVTKEIGITPKKQVHLFFEENNRLACDKNLYCINSTDSVLVAKLLVDGDYAKFWKQYENGTIQKPTCCYLWVFVPEDFIQKCQAKGIAISNELPDKKALSERISKLLGLNTDQQRDTIVYMKVPVNSLFRPAYVTEINKILSDGDIGNNANINQSDNQLKIWMIGQQMTNDYPWTRMGYTFDWGENIDKNNKYVDNIGVAEFVLRPCTGFDKFGFITIDKIYDNVGVWPGNGQSNR